MKRQELLVAALESGTVIDHIPSSKLFEVVNLLHLEQMKTSITVGYNLKSKKMGHKSIIKIAGKVLLGRRTESVGCGESECDLVYYPRL